MKRKWLPGSAAVAVMMIVLIGCGDTRDVRDMEATDRWPSGVEIEDDTTTHLAEDTETQDVMSDSEPGQETSEETKLLYRVYHYLPSDTDPEDDELVYEYAYDESGTLINKKEYKNNTVIFEYVYEYGQAGELVKSTRYFKGELDLWTEYGYDANGYLVQEKNYGAEGEIGSYIEYENDGFGNILKKVQYDPDGGFDSSTEYTYDASGNLMEMDHYFKITPHYDHEDRMEYAYDASGNLLKETYYINNRFANYNEYAYGPDGKLTRKEVHFISDLDGSDTLDDHYEYTYDEEGYLLTAVMYGRNGNVYFDEVNENTIEGYRYEYIPAKSH